MSRYVLVYRPNHPKASANGMVDTRDLGEDTTQRALDAPILTGRFYENNAIRTGENEYRDVGSRKRYRDYLKETGYTHASDFTGQWAKAAERRESVKRGERGALPSKSRREVLDRAFHKIRGY